jgi:2-polyprenyl-3-methyl-5-hydroxy-6-metoxy-1,4-benzoquinol methylase
MSPVCSKQRTIAIFSKLINEDRVKSSKIYMTTLNVPSLEDQRAYWDDRWSRSPKANNYQMRRGDAILRILRGLPLKNPEILDYGCGTGWFTEKLSHLGRATGIDLSETAIAIARRNFPDCNYIAGNVLEMPLQHSQYDVIVSQEVIAHIEDQAAYLERIGNMLKPGGYMIITTANPFVTKRLDWDHGPKAHIIDWLTRRQLKRLLARHYSVLRIFSIMPVGNRGIMRLLNSECLIGALGKIFTRARVESWQERLGLGYTIIVVTQKVDSKETR